jgi:hypothetical protein
MLVNLTGLYQDGSRPRGGGAQPDPRTTLTVPQGGDLTITLRVVTPAGSPYPLRLEDDLLLSVKKKTGDYPARITKRGVVFNGGATFTFQPADTRYLAAGAYLYDIWLTRESVRNPVLPASPLQITASVAAVPSAPPPQTLELVEGDTDPTVLDFNGVNITGWFVEMHVAYPVPLTRAGVLTDPANGVAEIQWQPTDLVVGIWGAELQITRPGPIIKTSQQFILKVRAQIV